MEVFLCSGKCNVLEFVFFSNRAPTRGSLIEGGVIFGRREMGTDGNIQEAVHGKAKGFHFCLCSRRSAPK